MKQSPYHHMLRDEAITLKRMGYSRAEARAEMTNHSLGLATKRHIAQAIKEGFDRR